MNARSPNPISRSRVLRGVVVRGVAVRAWAIVAACGLAMATSPALAKQPPATNNTPVKVEVTPITSLDQAEATLLQPKVGLAPNALDDGMVAAAAFALENLDADPKAIAILQLAMSRPEGDPAARATLRAIERAAAPSLRVFPLVASRSALVGESESAALTGALAAFPLRDAARLILRLGEQRALAQGSGVLDATAMAALRRLSGRMDLASDFQSWRDWLSAADQVSESQWRLAIAQAQGERAQRAEQERVSAVSRLVESLRRLHLATPADQRGALVAGLMQDAMGDVRSLGLELAGRELQASGRLSQEVGQAAIGLLASTDAYERTRAAEIVRQVAPEGAGPAVAAALAREQHPQAAGALIQAATRWPSDVTIDRTLRWLSRDGVAQRQALDATWALIRAGNLPADARQHALDLVRSIADSSLNGSACLILANLGEQADRDRLVPLLESEVAGVRVGAADGLIWEPQYLPAILAAAAKHTDIFDAAVRAVMVNDPSDENYRALASLPGATTDSGRRGLTRVAEIMPASDLSEIVRTTRDRVLRTDLLLLLTSPRRVESEWTDQANANAILDGGIDLARTRMNDGDLTGAASVLSALPLDAPDSATLASVPQAKLLRAVSVVALGRLDDPIAADAGVDAWVDALGYVTAPGERAILAHEIANRFANEMTDVQRAKVDQVLATEVLPAEGG